MGIDRNIIERLACVKSKKENVESAIMKFRKYKELKRRMGKPDRVVMDIEEMERNLRVLLEGKEL